MPEGQIETGPAWAPPSEPSSASPAPAGTALGESEPRSVRAQRGRGFRQRPIPLRPLSVLELIDGAVGAVPSVPRGLLVRAAAITTGSAGAALAVTWWFNRMIGALVQQNPTWSSFDLFGDPTDNYAPSFGERVALVTTEVLIAVVCSGFAATVLAGLFAPSVKAYVDAEPVDATQVRAMLKGRTARLYGLAALAALPRLILVFLFGVLTRMAAIHPASMISGWYFLIWLIFLPTCFWLTAVMAVAAPAAALEGASFGGALRRSRRLTSRGIFRSGWACLLTLLIAAAATVSLDAFGWEVRDGFGVGDQFAGVPGSPGFSWWLVVYVVTYILTLLLTTPYRAATATLLYVDRRFRREGLDIRIAWARLANDAARRTKQGSTI